MKSLTGLLLLSITLYAQVAVPVPQPGNVTLPLDEYNKLVELADKPAAPANTPPQPFALQHAHLVLQVSGPEASGSAQLEGEVLAKGAVKIPLGAGMVVFGARGDHGDLPLTWNGSGSATVLNGPADFRIDLDVGMPVLLEAGRASLNIPAPPAGTVELQLVVPGDNTIVTMLGGLIVSHTSAGGKTTVDATLTAGQLASVSWATREAPEPAAPKEVRYLSDVKSLITVGEADIAMAALAEITVVQGEPAELTVNIPPGWEVTGATGATLESSEMQSGALVLKVNGTARSHAFLITMERLVADNREETAKADAAMISFPGAQRETGEIVVEAEGTMELTATEAGGLKRMDLKEAGAYLQSMAHQSAQAAFRYHRQPGESPRVTLGWTRFPDSKLPGAVAESATATTLVTGEGRSLTEIKLLVRNREQPFLKVALPAGASIVSAEVAGNSVKPVQGADGNRVPLLRAGFRPAGAYNVSFVILHSGTPFANKGGADLELPKMDVPIGVVEWEVFLPQRYRVKDFGGDVVAATLLPRGGPPVAIINTRLEFGPGSINGVVRDPAGAVVPRASVTLRDEATGASRTVTTDKSGEWVIEGMPSGNLLMTVNALGFRTYVRSIRYRPEETIRADAILEVGATSETVTVTAQAPLLKTESAEVSHQGNQKKVQDLPPPPPSANVLNLQQRVSGVLPIPIAVPKAGTSYRFVRPLVVDEETKLTFNYRVGR